MSILHGKIVLNKIFKYSNSIERIMFTIKKISMFYQSIVIIIIHDQEPSWFDYLEKVKQPQQKNVYSYIIFL